MVCRHCGTENTDNVTFCVKCKAILRAGKIDVADVISLDDLIEHSWVVANRMAEAPPEPVLPPPPPKIEPIVQPKAALIQIEPESATPEPISYTLGPPPKVEVPPVVSIITPPVIEPPNSHKGYLSYRRTDTGLLVLTKAANFRRRIAAAIYDNLLLTTLIGLPGACLVALLASRGVRIDIFRRTSGVLENIANSYVRFVIVGFVLLFTLVSFAYFLLMTTLGGQTSGKRYLNIRVARADGKTPGLRHSFIRTLYGLPINLILLAAVYFERPEVALLTLPWLGGIAALFFLPMHQGLHDRVAGTYVVGIKEMVEDIDF